MLPVIEGQIVRRVLLNYRTDPAVVARLLPPPLEVLTHHGHAIVGICLIQFAQLRPKGAPSALGLASQNAAHRVAIRFKQNGQWCDGVFIWRRDTDCRLISLLGGRLFPGVHDHARFEILEGGEHFEMKMKTRLGDADVAYAAKVSREWKAASVFKNFEEACAFFKRGDCGFSCAQSANLEGIQLRTLEWKMEALDVTDVQSTFYENPEKFPRDSLKFDCGLLMRNIPHEWHEIDNPEI
jgi:uncharacterized protein YqjF (DUF2071 family)